MEQIRRYLKADSLGYLSQEGMIKATGLPADGFCTACYDSRYPVQFNPELEKFIMERRKSRIESLGEQIVKKDREPRLF